jgi:hypothetical protein
MESFPTSPTSVDGASSLSGNAPHPTLVNQEKGTLKKKIDISDNTLDLHATWDTYADRNPCNHVKHNQDQQQDVKKGPALESARGGAIQGA